MDYKNFLKDFIERTQKNLKEYHGEYEVTQLINSLLGLVTIPQSWEYSSLDKIIFDFKEFLNNQQDDIYSNMEFKDFIRHIRNGIAHGYIYTDASTSDSSSDREINFIIIADYNPKKHNNECLKKLEKKYDEVPNDFDYAFEFRVEYFKKFVMKFSDEILNVLKEKYK